MSTLKNLTILLSLSLVPISPLCADGLASIRKTFAEVAIVNYAHSEEETSLFMECSEYGEANDVLLLQLYDYIALPDEEVERLFALYDSEEGCFSDIDYNSKARGRWRPTLQLTRLLAVTRLYADPESSWYKDERLHDMIHGSIAYWGRTQPTAPNWWHNEIGISKKLITTMLIIFDELSEEELSIGLSFLDRCDFGKTGQNKVWLAGNQLLRALLTDDEALAAKAKEQIAEEIRVATPEEGIQEDWSFQQHGPQIQFGNYGLTYLDVLSFWMRVLHGTDLDFTPEQYEIVRNLYVDGVNWSVWNGLMDPSFCGRQVFKGSGRGKACALYVAGQNLETMMDLGDSNPVGPKYFWTSDCGIYRTQDWYSSIRMHSTRTVGFEFTNKENMGGWFSADGALLLMQHGHEYEDVFAYWDWRKLPGVTAYDDGKPLKTDNNVNAKMNNTPHVGGADVGKDKMISSMMIERDGVHALKSDFFFKNMIVALGTAISTDNPEVFSLTTALDQNRLVEDSNGNPLVERGTGWAWHDDRGYVLLDGNTLEVETGLQRGDWGLTDPSLEGQLDSGRVFKCWVNHDVTAKDNSYAYVLLPQRNAAKTKRFARRPRLKVTRNDDECQAIKYRGRIYAVVHEEGEITLGRRTYHFSEPSIAILRGRKADIRPLVR